MRGSRFLLPLRLPLMAGVLLALFLLAGSLADYPLSCALYDPRNFFGRFFAAFGEYPAGLGLTAAGVMLVLGRNPQRRLIAGLQVAAGVWCVLSGAALTALLPMNYLPVGPAASTVIGLPARWPPLWPPVRCAAGRTGGGCCALRGCSCWSSSANCC